MTGGSDRRGLGGVPLHARVRSTAPDAPGTADAPSWASDADGREPLGPARTAEPRPLRNCPVKHCWVDAPADGGPPRPGLLLEWRKDRVGRWEGRVLYAAELRPGHWATVEEWLAAELLSTA